MQWPVPIKNAGTWTVPKLKGELFMKATGYRYLVDFLFFVGMLLLTRSYC